MNKLFAIACIALACGFAQAAHDSAEFMAKLAELDEATNKTVTKFTDMIFETRDIFTASENESPEMIIRHKLNINSIGGQEDAHRVWQLVHDLTEGTEEHGALHDNDLVVEGTETLKEDKKAKVAELLTKTLVEPCVRYVKHFDGVFADVNNFRKIRDLDNELLKTPDFSTGLARYRVCKNFAENDYEQVLNKILIEMARGSMPERHKH